MWADRCYATMADSSAVAPQCRCSKPAAQAIQRSSLAAPAKERMAIRMRCEPARIMARSESLVGLPKAPPASAKTGRLSMLIKSLPMPL